MKTNPYRIVLTSFHGNCFRGNTRILFEELCKHSYLEPIWLSRDKKIVESLKSEYGSNRAEMQHSIPGLKALAEANSILFTHGTSDYPFLYLPRTAQRIQTYHGLPTKRGEYLRPKSNKEPGWLHKKVLEYRFKPISHFLTSSPAVTDVFSKRFRIPENQFLPTGYPAYDKLFKKTDSFSNWAEHFPVLNNTDHIFLYAPTFRKLSRTKWFPFEDFDLNVLSQFLEKNKIVMALRPHPNEKASIKNVNKYSDRILLLDHHVAEDVTEILPILSGIITDYSSIYLEGLLLNIPVIFIPYDLNRYERGFAFPYEKITPGPKVSNLDQFQKEISDIVSGKESYVFDREKLKTFFFSYQDGNATGKVIRFLENSANG